MSDNAKIVRVQGLDFQVRDTGDQQPALVFLHYWGGTGRTWGLVIRELADRHRCVAPDLRGWGGSDKKADDYGLHTQADDVAAIIASLGLSQYILVGQSMGGKIAQILGARRPGAEKARAGRACSSHADRRTEGATRRHARKLSDPGRCRVRSLNPDVKAAFSNAPAAGDRRYAGGAPAAKAAWTQAGMTLDITEIVEDINVPTTVIVGNADKVETEPLLRRELASRISGTEFIVLPGVGHLSPLEAPGELAAAITTAISKIR
jgi:pimeloyl-ACP methyl ester carboxylesterase